MPNASHHSEVFRKPGCPYGKKAIALLEEQGVDFDDHVFESMEQEQQFKSDHSVSTTPLVFLKGERIGGYDELKKHFNS